MTKDNLMSLAKKMATKLLGQQKQKLSKQKRLLNKVKELNDNMDEFEEKRNILPN